MENLWKQISHISHPHLPHPHLHPPSPSFEVKDLEVDLYNYYPTTYLYRYVNYQVLSEYVHPHKYHIIVRRIDANEGWTDNLTVLAVHNVNKNDGTESSEIVIIPNSDTNEQIVEVNTSFPIEPSTKKVERLPVLNLLPHDVSEHRISREEFNRMFPNANVSPLPTSLFAVGIKHKQLWMYNQDYSHYMNIYHPIQHIVKVALKYELDDFYFIICSCDGYLQGVYHSENRNILKRVEHIEPNQYLVSPQHNEIPVFHNKITILSQSSHVGMPYNVNIVDRHYFYHNLYHSFASFHMGIPFHLKTNKIVFAGQNRDMKFNFYKLKMEIPPRQYFREFVAPKYSDIIVCKNGWITRETMAQNYKYILDIDGEASTFDATHWKMKSGSVLFKPKSIWRQWFYDEFLPGVHYVELKEDFSDILEKYQWCESHPEECLKMIENCKELCKKIYCFTNVVKYTKSVIEGLKD